VGGVGFSFFFYSFAIMMRLERDVNSMETGREAKRAKRREDSKIGK